MRELPVVESCDDCAACCLSTPVPPFQPGEASIREVPEELLKLIQERNDRDEQFDMLPCVWLDETTKRCRHYELRPEACRDFEIGGMLCRMARRDVNLPG